MERCTETAITTIRTTTITNQHYFDEQVERPRQLEDIHWSIL